ncbi:tripartite tricarboxylate transporter substrate-binding protein [Cupriavidus necator]|uniref:tripartite tricarboxylate transporter substrate-binding protein n=1 Tax=Cupriavidus necator TaxID=106590 RepID=UPI0022A80CBA|nr:tripartite tricarboxylate transporter substrate-binding protein [Cupriavidus necator]
MVFAVGPTVHSDSIKAFIAQARAKPGAMTYGSAGNGSAGNVAFEMLKQTAHIVSKAAPHGRAHGGNFRTASGALDHLASGPGGGGSR